ncbi:hypothetical protein ATCR1_06581 [Agrobacterium tumefaciens CCNWGS0286]|nr:hypothetical protein ATCR1_06581 [Agrobacterium tumefaciens CCNWGS0286]
MAEADFSGVGKDIMGLAWDDVFLLPETDCSGITQCKTPRTWGSAAFWFQSCGLLPQKA